MSTPEMLMSLIPEHLQRSAWSADAIAEYRRTALRAMLANAIANSPFHARRLAGLDPSTFEMEDLAGLPVMSKDEMMESFDDLVTDRRVSRALAEQHLSTVGETPTLLLGDYVVLASGGSSGVRGMFLYGPQAAAEYALGGLRRSLAQMMAGGMAGGPPRAAMVAATSGVHATRGLPALFSGGMMDITCIPAALPLPEIVRRLEELKPSTLSGYPTVLAMLADEKAAGRLAIAPNAVTANSEPLTAEIRERIERGFGVGAVDQFGASEGIMGSSDPGSGAIAMPADLVILELVDEQGRAVPPGTESAKVYLTTLYNPVQPLIRYELSDRMTLVDTGAADGHPRVTVTGRSDDLLRYGDVVVHPHAIRSVLVHTPAVREYQVKQTGEGVDLDVVCYGTPLDSADLEARTVKALAAAGLASPRVHVRVVDALPRDERSGKVRRIVPRK